MNNVNKNIPQIGLGCANLGNLYRAHTDEHCHSILQTAWDNNIRFYDTAPHYGLGLSETRLGSFIKNKERSELIISTKVGRLLNKTSNPNNAIDSENDFWVPKDYERAWGFSASDIIRSLNESKQRLQTDYIDIVYLHDPERSPIKEGESLEHKITKALETLKELQEKGEIGLIGVGAMTTETLTISAKTKLADVLMIAGRYTLIDQSTQKETINACIENNVGVVLASIFNSGILAKDTLESSARFDYKQANAKQIKKLQAIASICHKYEIGVSTAALQYGLRKIKSYEYNENLPFQSVVLAASSAEQLQSNIDKLKVNIPENFWQELTETKLIY